MQFSVRRDCAVGALAALLASLLASQAAQAASIAALQDGKSIVWIDTQQMRVTGTTVLAGGASLVGIDVRPADGKLYGLTPDGGVVTLDARTGKWEKKSQLTEKLPSGVTFAVDFNPAADRLRVLTNTGMSYRINVEDGKTTVDGSLKFADADVHKGMTANVIAAAYSNSYAGSKETSLYDIDRGTAALLKQAPPNDGTLNTIGKLGVGLDAPVAFDIAADGKGGNTGWMLMGGALYAIDLANGQAKSAGKIAGLKGSILDIAILPSE
jgi:outer membrane protein assembly factor BamB